MKPFLLIDVGNTRLKWAEAGPRGAIRTLGELPTRKVTAGAFADWTKKYGRHGVVVATVVPKISRLLARHLPGATYVNGALPGLPLAFNYPQPAEIGADRLAAAIGVRTRRAAIIVSCGTATAFSVLDGAGRFCGGAIAPGLNAQLQALVGATAQLPVTTLPPAPPALGRSTQAAIRAGLVIGYQGGVREIITRLRAELGAPARIVVTGGDAARLRGLRGLGRIEFRPLLVFEGLRIIAASLFES